MQFVPVNYFYEPQYVRVPVARSPRYRRHCMSDYEEYLAQQEYLEALREKKRQEEMQRQLYLRRQAEARRRQQLQRKAEEEELLRRQQHQMSLENALEALLGLREAEYEESEEDEDTPMDNDVENHQQKESVGSADESELYDRIPMETTNRRRTIRVPVFDYKGRGPSTSAVPQAQPSPDVDGDEKTENPPSPVASASAKKSEVENASVLPTVEDRQSETQESASESETENYEETLKTIEGKVKDAVETYQRLFDAETSSGSDSDGYYTVKSLTSRIKVLQKTQMRLEQLYEQLDGLPKGHGQNKKVRRDLTSKSVSVADKVDDLLRVLESRRTALLEKQKSSETESESETEKPQTPKKVRHVSIETVPDEDF
ncbi:hypothetical protein TRICI_005805 [Trichomonascus ciferrii]|uniref:BAG domain-containing protein n=1 Tax=Trichomonascus ciferrii TaxID=44093 RepID=A0A642UPK1_9ASCO|nr:hypothetical protein TRICI_005805 [Trichomonascus ciferrii]